MPTTSAKPAITVSIVENEKDPAWALMMAQRKELKAKLIMFDPETLWDCHYRTFLVAQINNCVVGITSIRKQSAYHENGMSVGYVNTHKDYNNLGVATAMVKALFAHAKLTGKALVNSRYEPEGEIYLQHVMQRESNKYPDLEFVERDFTM